MMMQNADSAGSNDQLSEAFRLYQQAGQNIYAKSCLKYVALTSMLSRSEINPFDAREAKVFERDADVVGYDEMRMHLGWDSDLQRFEQVLSDKKNASWMTHSSCSTSSHCVPARERRFSSI